MPLNPSSTEYLLTAISAFAWAALAVRLFIAKLHSSHSALFLYAVFSAFRGFFFLSLPPGTNLYGYSWLVSEAILLFLFVLLVLELYGQILSKFASLASFSKSVFRWTIGLALVGSAITLIPDLGQAASSRLVSNFLVIQRGVVTSLLLFIVLLLLLLLWYPIRISRNTFVHAAIFSVYFFVKSGLLVILQMLGISMYRSASTALIGLSILCVTAWLVLLTKKGETVEVRVGHSWNEEESERLVRQLESFNSTLTRVTRR